MPDSGQQYYRFQGRTPPTPGHRTPIKAEMAGTATDGVATMRLYDAIDSWGGDWGVSAKEFAAALADIGEVNEIRLHINSPGGEVFEGIAIMNQLRNHPAKVVAVVDGIAASSASFIAASADEVIMNRNAEFMIHDAHGICIGNAGVMTDLADRLNHLSDNIASVYAERTNKPVSEWRDAMLAETWYSADEAVEAGLADRVEAKPESAAPKNKFDLSMFAYEGRAEAPEPGQHAPLPEVPPGSDAEQSADEAASDSAADEAAESDTAESADEGSVMSAHLAFVEYEARLQLGG